MEKAQIKTKFYKFGKSVYVGHGDIDIDINGKKPDEEYESYNIADEEAMELAKNWENKPKLRNKLKKVNKNSIINQQDK